MSAEFHVGDTGTIIEMTLTDGSSPVDISTATVKQIFASIKGSAAVKTFAATFKTDGTDGILQYITAAVDFDAEGIWELQARVVFPGGEWRSNLALMRVYRNL